VNGKREFIKVQGTGEEATFSRGQLDRLVELAESGIRSIRELQLRALG